MSFKRKIKRTEKNTFFSQALSIRNGHSSHYYSQECLNYNSTLSNSNKIELASVHDDVRNQPLYLNDDGHLIDSFKLADILNKAKEKIINNSFLDAIDEYDRILSEKILEKFLEKYPSQYEFYILNMYEIFNNRGVAYYYVDNNELSIRDFLRSTIYEYLYLLQDIVYNTSRADDFSFDIEKKMTSIYNIGFIGFNNLRHMNSYVAFDDVVKFQLLYLTNNYSRMQDLSFVHLLNMTIVLYYLMYNTVCYNHNNLSDVFCKNSSELFRKFKALNKNDFNNKGKRAGFLDDFNEVCNYIPVDINFDSICYRMLCDIYPDICVKDGDFSFQPVIINGINRDLLKIDVFKGIMI